VTKQEEAERFVKTAPPLSRVELEEINALFPTYIFRRSKTREVWTTCCHRHETLRNRTAPDMDQMEYAVLSKLHQREPKNRYQSVPKETVKCPFCGRLSIVKELGRTGRRDNLSRYRRAVVLRWYRGALWARAYDCSKHYKDSYSLTGDPDCHLVGVYRFQPGLTEASARYYWDYPFESIQRQDTGLVKGHWNIYGPFHANAQYGVGYDVIGLEEIQKSPFRYCMVEEAEKKTDKFLQFLTACCFYPRQIEMLMKAGMSDVVIDLTERGVKHAAVINWEEADPKKGFKLSRQELKFFLSTSRDIRIPELYKRLEGRAKLEECADWIMNGLNIQRTFQAAKKWGLAPEKLIRYLNGNVGCASYGGMGSLDSALRYWEDYLTAAEAMNYPLHHENVLFPRNLGAAHDNATKEHGEQLARELAARQREWDRQRKAEQAERDRQARLAEEKYEERRMKLEKKYSFVMDGYMIRVPAGKDEILDEGRRLQHCVGGYADRHIQGKTTILFMRKAKKPGVPWLTIEMNGNKLVQIHGFRNEGIHTTKGRFAPDPREEYRAFLDTWLDWLEKGNRRDKEGNPKLPRRKGAAA